MSDVKIYPAAFSSGFNFGFQKGLQSLSLSVSSSDVEVNIFVPELPDVFDTPVIKNNSFFDKSSDCYNSEKELYDIAEMCLWNNFGIKCEYYFVDYNTEYDPMFGEDRDRTVLRSVSVKASIELPKEEENVSIFGIEGMDVFEIFINKTHFAYASTFSADSSGVFPETEPKEGDVLRTKYNDKFYEIVSVKDTTNQFLQTQYTWTLIAREYKDTHFNISGTTTEVEKISSVTNQKDLFDINDDINNEKEDFIITSAMDEEAGREGMDNVFGEW